MSKLSAIERALVHMENADQRHSTALSQLNLAREMVENSSESRRKCHNDFIIAMAAKSSEIQLLVKLLDEGKYNLLRNDISKARGET